MKKIAQALCILLCLAMVLSFAAMAFAAEDTYATIDFADQSFRTSLDTSAKEQVWESNGLKITVGNEKEYDDHVRFNKNNKVTIEYPGMKNIVFVCPHDAYAKYFEDIVDGMEGVSVSIENYIATVTFDEPQDSWEISVAKATRVEKMTVYTGDVFDVEGEVIEPDVVDVPEVDKAYKFAYESEIKVYSNGKVVAATGALNADKDL